MAEQPLPTSGLHYDIPEPQYHADPNSLSSSHAKTLIYDGPDALHEKAGAPATYNDNFDFGSVVHALVLGVGDYQIVEHDSYRTKLARAERDALRAKGVAPILPSKMEEALAMQASILRHPEAAELLSEGAPEVSMWAEDPLTGVVMKGRIDWWNRAVIDLKTTGTELSRANWVHTVWSFRYAFQFAYYNKILKLNGIKPRRPRWIVVSKRAPYETGVCAASDELLRRSERDVDRALWLYAHCKENDSWPTLRQAFDVPGVGAPPRGAGIPFLESVEEGLTHTEV